jgi:hypothetical protein
MTAEIRSMGNALRYQYEAGAAIDTDLVGGSLLLRRVRNRR